MLINFLMSIFRKYVYTPHIHNFVLDRTIQTHTEVNGFTASGTVIIYKCESCGRVIKLKD